MNKAYTRIDWENEPSTNTPINETNLNKMDSALDELDNRVIAQDTSKADKTEVSTLIANVEFNESTGIITVTRKNGSSFTIDTKLEKIAINFTYDKDTQQIILTLVDGTKQYIDLSALITQYEFLDSDTITFVVQSDGKIKAEVLDGSITERKLQPNYLAQIKVETAKSESYMNNASQSAKSSSDSANMSKSYAVGGTGTREGEDNDNAKYYSDNAKPLAKMISGTNLTVQDSTHAPWIYGKFSGYTVQDGTPTPDAPIDIQGLGDSSVIEVKTFPKNFVDFSKCTDGYMLAWNTGALYTSSSHFVTDYIEVEPNTTYTRQGFLSGDECWYYDENKTPIKSISGATFTTPSNCRYIRLTGTLSTKGTQQVELGDTATPYTEYQEPTQALIPVTAPLYDGDYMEVYADGSGKIVRNFAKKVITSVSSSNCWLKANAYYAIFLPTGVAKGGSIKAYSDHYINNGTINENENNIFVNYSNSLVICDKRFSTLDELNEWLQSNTVTALYELATPTEETLTAEQVAEFRKLYTFDNITNVFCDGEVALRYYVNNECGDTVGRLQDLAYLNNMPVGTIIQVDFQYDIIDITNMYDNWEYLGTSSVDCLSGGASISYKTNVYRKIK